MLALIICARFWYSHNKTNDKNFVSAAQQKVPLDGSSDWKNYTSKTWGFSLKYPAKFSPEIEENASLMKTSPMSGLDAFLISDPTHQGRYLFTVHIAPDLTTYNSIDELIASLEKDGGHPKKINLNGINAIISATTTGPIGAKVPSEMISMIKSRRYYQIFFMPSDNQDFNKILSTFTLAP